TLGVLVPLSDAVALIGKPILSGAEIAVAQRNAEGGIGGKYQVKLVAEDVTYANPSTSVQKYNKLKDQVAGFAFILGTDHVNVTLPLLAEDTLLAVPSTMDAEWVREPQLVSVLAPYQIEVINGVDYWVTQGGGKGKTLCSMAMSTGYGAAGEEGAAFAAQALGTTVKASAKFKPGDQDYVAPITQLKNAGCEGVVLVSLPTETGKILGTAAQLQFAPRWIATGPSWHKVLGQSPIAGYAQQHLWMALDGPAWGDTTVAGMAKLLKALAAYAPQQQPDSYVLAGYVFANSILAVLDEAAKQGDLSRTGVARALTTLGTVSNGGLTGDYRYGPIETREPPRVVSIHKPDPASPNGFGMVSRDYTSAAASAFKIEKKR
ncbi:MAG TPA: ABC transporter substrate-binding protein, partial [Gemmatimonadaceae bacterium]|nr:ABC transporter substrate-binding protein [Gemmatimonadaceae bacterium]